ncbi:hypothetical protein GYMLUDRAFT_56792 [Collybiopsis luxurians FD-317 M1]|nr:hypothetical protein GYMLUDRAFT_56792 [Collybiopsis luxurians FD-317 M1]
MSSPGTVNRDVCNVSNYPYAQRPRFKNVLNPNERVIAQWNARDLTELSHKAACRTATSTNDRLTGTMSSVDRDDLDSQVAYQFMIYQLAKDGSRRTKMEDLIREFWEYSDPDDSSPLWTISTIQIIRGMVNDDCGFTVTSLFSAVSLPVDDR